jgi:asparagine synthase (glutamine-hydrolysing)
MTEDSLANPLFGLVARSQRGLGLLIPETLHDWVRAWVAKSMPSDWWIERESGIALFRPELNVQDSATGRRAALCIRGTVYGSIREDPPAAWPKLPPGKGTSTVLYDVLDRDLDAISQLRGQFALACWDGRRRRLSLARDHLGQRAIYILTTPDLYVFCSELSPLLRSPASCYLDPEAAYWYLAFGMPPPGRTLARSISRVPAAHVASWQPGELVQFQRYWTPLTAEAPCEATTNVVDEIRSKVDEAVWRYLPEDETLGLLLSGGVDSTYLGATATALGARLHAFTAAFEQQESLNENEYAHAAAKWLGAKHEIVVLEPQSSLHLLQDVVLKASEPCGAWAVISHFRLLASAASKGIKVTLSGLGADEIFGGYDHFRGYYSRFLRYQLSHKMPEGGLPLQMILSYENQSSRRVLYPGVARCFDDVALRKACGPAFKGFHYASYLRAFYRECLQLKPEASAMELMVAHECQHRIPDELFATFEPVSRDFGIEVGYPFLDPDLVRMVIGLNAENRYRTRSGKFSLRLRELHPRFKHAMMQIAKGRVPEAIRTRQRKSFTFPFGAWFSHPKFSRPLLASVHASRFWDTGILRRPWLDQMVRRLSPTPTPTVFQLWAVLTLVAWFDHFVENSEQS